MRLAVTTSAILVAAAVAMPGAAQARGIFGCDADGGKQEGGAVIGAIVGEYLGGSSGLGHLLIARLNAFETDQMFAVLIHMSLLGFTFYFLIGALRRRLIPWHASARPRL